MMREQGGPAACPWGLAHRVKRSETTGVTSLKQGRVRDERREIGVKMRWKNSFISIELMEEEMVMLA